ncbi:MAG TPA: nuclear transport factor 2 family protein [Blastocatellia bacterium]|nr:nuclear transport factor 2 family protein [Blastocatellia bacterium]
MVRHLFRTLVLSAIALSVVIVAAAQTGAKGKETASDAEFKKLISEYYDAWNTLNPDNAAKYYAKDASLVFYDIAPLKYNGWGEYHDGVIKNFFQVTTNAKLTPKDDLKVSRRGNIAWTTLTFHLSAKLKAGDSLDMDCRHTAIWELRDGKWLIVHEHVSAPLPG